MKEPKKDVSLHEVRAKERNGKNLWTELEADILINMREAGLDFDIISDTLKRTKESCRRRYYYYKEGEYPYTKFIKGHAMQDCGEPIKATGNALIMSDTEFPYQHNEFINKCVDLAVHWGIDTCIIGGDFVHFGNLSTFSRGFLPSKQNKLPQAMEVIVDALTEHIQSLKSNKEKEEGLAILDSIEEIGYGDEEDRNNLSIELEHARKGIAQLVDPFANFHIILGNHDARYARTFTQAGTEIQELKTILKLPEKCEMSSFYFGFLTSNGEVFQIEHPTNSTKFSARRLAGKYQKHVLMGHNHQYVDTFDPSGKYWAIEMGCCSDENKMPYSALRHSAVDQHALGAVIVRDGYPWHLGENTPWAQMKKMK